MYIITRYQNGFNFIWGMRILLSGPEQPTQNSDKKCKRRPSARDTVNLQEQSRVVVGWIKCEM